MIDKAPQVDFNDPFLHLKALRGQRERLRSVVEDIRSSIRNLNQIEGEAHRDAAMAAMWAATLMVCDILKIGLAAADKRASLIFSAQDRAVQSANRILKLFGAPTITTKADLMKSVSAELTPAAKATENLRTAMAELKKLKVPTTGQPIPVRIPKEAGLLVDLGVAMAQDTILLLEAGQLQRQASANVAQSRVMMRDQLTRVLTRLMLIESEFAREFDRLWRMASIA